MRQWQYYLLLVIAGFAPASFAGEEGHLSYAPGTTPAQAPVFLQGGVQQLDRLPPPPGFCQARGFAAYQQGWYALGHQQIQVAADYFQIAGDQLEAGTGASRFLAEARFAEAQCRKLMGQYDRSADCYKRAIAIFEQTDPRSFYLKSAHDALKDMARFQKAPLKGEVKKTAAPPPLKALAPIPDITSVSRETTLSANITQLDNGVSLTTLKDGALFNRSRGMLTQTAVVDVSEAYTKDAVKRAFLKMNCLEMTTVGATHYSAPSFYKNITANGKPVAVGGGSDLLCPIAELKINGKIHKVPMDLPHISANSRNVLLVTDGKHILAIDPRNNDAWKLCANFSKKIPDFNWWKLGRQKGRKIT